jgi:uncharacterized membrane protein
MINRRTLSNHLVVCHKRPERSFFYKGKQFPVCARCTGSFVGYGAFPFLLLGILRINIWTAVLLNVPTLIDGTTQLLGWRKSNNTLRFITGILSGVGQMAVVVLSGQAVGLFIVRLLGIQ